MKNSITGSLFPDLEREHVSTAHSSRLRDKDQKSNSIENSQKTEKKEVSAS
ncbi:MAG: hypothetical protein FWD99_03990 [Oscillospiraceae bacterium]|nr:hypothetical protein [Oscillospiraceae bacterium]